MTMWNHVGGRAISGVGAAALMAMLGLGSPSTSYGDVSLDFSGASDFSDNFRVTSAGGLGFSIENGSAKVSYASRGAIVYDANGTAAGQSTFTVTKATLLTFSVDFKVGTNISAFGVYLMDPAHETASSADKTSWLALLAVNSNAAGASSTSEYLRIWNDVANPGDASVGTTADATVYADSITTNQWLTLTLAYSLNDAGKAVIDYSVGPRGETATITKQTVWDTPLTTFEIGFRHYNVGMGTTYFDNFNVTQIPEISSLCILGAGSLLALTRKSK